MTILQEPTTRPPLTTCPDWCTLPPEHGWDSFTDGGVWFRGHAGPDFGCVSTGGNERSDTPGQVKLDACLDPAVGEDVIEAGALRKLTDDCSRAAEWIEAHQ